MAAKVRFTPERRERLLTLIEAGRTLEAACADVEIARGTVQKWRARGRQDESGEWAVFAERLDGLLQGTGPERLAEEDVIGLVEAAARRGSVTAMKVLLDRFKEARERDGSEDTVTPPASSFLDELAARRGKAA